jgi:hypothetical protein
MRQGRHREILRQPQFPLSGTRLPRPFRRRTGEINWGFVLPELERLGYDGYIGCEYRPKTTTTAGLGWLTLFCRRDAEV